MFGFLEDAVRAVGGAIEDVVDAVGDAGEAVGGALADAAEWTGGALVDGADWTVDALGDVVTFGAGAAGRFAEKVWDGMVDTFESATESPLGFLETAGLTLLTLPLGPVLTAVKAGEALVEQAEA